MKKILIIQPHSDDVFLSCYHLLRLSKQGFLELNILTVSNDPKRIEEDKRMADYFSAKIVSFNGEYKDNSYSNYWKTHKTFDEFDLARFFFKNDDRKQFLDTMKELQSVALKYKLKEYIVFSPFGAGHPFHYQVSFCLRKLANFFYRDFPHSYKPLRGLKFFKEKVANYEMVNSVDMRVFQPEKIREFGEFYKSQSGFLFYEKNNLEKCLPEEIYIKKQ
ncbi:MAG TPA: hypothetical protein PKY56_09930 [Candidatus Kapabacteria bacterium]|nr:hypothetical protein [Candidatus Kapabacteria bacterium]